MHEDVCLDFKEASKPTLGFDKDDQKNYSKAVSGFANEGGGLIVWGIKCIRDPETDMDVATELKPISNAKGFLSKLNSLAGQTTDPAVGGIQNKCVISRGDGGFGFILTYVPQGADAPYRAIMAGGEFYGRSGSSFFPLATHQIRRLMMLTSSPDLDVGYKLQKSGTSSGPHGERYNVDIIISLRNDSNGVATHPYIEIVGPDGLKTSSIYEYSQSKLLERVPLGAYVGGADVACYPGVDLNVTRTSLIINPKANVGINNVYEYQISFTALNCPLKKKVLRITQEEICKVWGCGLCRVEPR